MKNLSINKFGKIVYKNIETDFSCENIFNIFLENDNFNLSKFLDNEIKEDLRESKINHLLNT